MSPTQMDEISELHARLEEAEQTLHAIRCGEIDALIINGPEGEQVYSLTGSDFIYRVIVETMNEAALTVTADGVITFANNRFYDILKAPSSEILGQKLSDFLEDSDHTTLIELITHTQGTPSRQRFILNAQDGTKVPTQVSASTLNNISHTSTCLIVSDLTDLEESHQRIQSLSNTKQKLEANQDTLERIVNERTAALVQANQTLQNQAGQLRTLALELTMSEQRARRQLSKILHDGLQQYLVAAKMQVGGLVEQATDKVMKHTATEAEYLLGESIRVSRSLAAELSPPILHDGGLWAALGWLARWMSEKHGLVVDLTMQIGGTPVVADNMKVLLFESVRELLLNVAKHAGTTTVGVKLSHTQNDELLITVEDHGKGFDVATASATGENRSGFGLFSISERIHLLGGKFEMHSSPGHGAAFVMCVPHTVLEEPIPETRRDPQEPDSTSLQQPVGKIRILLTDDQAVMREGLANLLGQELDFEVVGQAHDGQEAVEKAELLQPDVILMDISMPRMNGIVATRTIHAQYPKIHIIGLSLYTEDERAREMLEAGVTFYISKSGPPADLKAAIRACRPRLCPQLVPS